MNINRNHGLDTLRASAIILVFMFHYDSFFSNGHPIFGAFGRIGYVGVDLFFVLSGYLIGNQVFSALAKRQTFSLKNFYYRRCLRTLPNYLVVLSIYFCIPLFREKPLLTPLWKFLTFTQNFGLHGGAFSHAWSLCIEEQFYLVLPLIALLIAYKGSIRIAWSVIATLLLAGILWRASIWLIYLREMGDHISPIYVTKIYFSTFSRLDGLLWGIALAMLKNFHQELWLRITAKGSLWLVLGILGCCFTCYDFDNLSWFFATTCGYPLRTISFAALTLAALSPKTLLNKMRIPGAMTLATWSYAIYLTHKPLIHLTQIMLSYWSIDEATVVAVIMKILISLLGGWLLYFCIERPFLKLRDKLGNVQATEPTLASIA